MVGEFDNATIWEVVEGSKAPTPLCLSLSTTDSVSVLAKNVSCRDFADPDCKSTV